MLCQELPAPDGIGDDDDAMVIEDNSVAPNTICPLSGKNVRQVHIIYITTNTNCRKITSFCAFHFIGEL